MVLSRQQNAGQNHNLLIANESFGFHKRRGISWRAEWLLDSQEGLCSMEL